MNKIKKPIINKIISEIDINEISFDDDRVIIDKYFFDNTCLKEIDNVEFNGCVFKNINFSQCQIKNSNFIDCKFDTCNLSSMEINQKLFLRCEFISCNLIGISIIDSSIKEVYFIDCNLEYSNFSSFINNVIFKNCNNPYTTLIIPSINITLIINSLFLLFLTSDATIKSDKYERITIYPSFLYSEPIKHDTIFPERSVEISPNIANKIINIYFLRFILLIINKIIDANSIKYNI